ncbi:hypothetical protein D9V29_13605 [Mycetocola manganoxydans]|uniref:Uncharacterized protein n=1 Tax=Mycetocola manganoxydans TaxID=699879 RepID=A0A3L6ZKZ5_9MICO|nr:hypothetical protein [Mycetocola manganoxydans]RLP68513.1 hypothetical protein D9V29_13605 [Mycetocola manganoxydans]
MSPLPLVRLSPFNRILIVALVLGAVLIGSLALHSVTGARGMEAFSSSTTQSHADDESAHQAAATAGGANVQSGAITQNVTCDEQCALDCALMAMMCVLLLILTVITILARHPDIRRRLVQSSRRSIDAIAAARQHIYRPSLTVLSISRT